MADPGWYPDPERPGQLRWYDGLNWTEQRAAVQAPSPPRAAPSANPLLAPLAALVAVVVALAEHFLDLTQRISEPIDGLDGDRFFLVAFVVAGVLYAVPFGAAVAVLAGPRRGSSILLGAGAAAAGAVVGSAVLSEVLENVVRGDGPGAVPLLAFAIMGALLGAGAGASQGGAGVLGGAVGGLVGFGLLGAAAGVLSFDSTQLALRPFADFRGDSWRSAGGALLAFGITGLGIGVAAQAGQSSR